MIITTKLLMVNEKVILKDSAVYEKLEILNITYKIFKNYLRTWHQINKTFVIVLKSVALKTVLY